MKFAYFVLLMAISGQATVLTDIERRVGHAQSPVVVFDLDDTLFETRPRTLEVLRDFVLQPKIGYVYRREFEIVREARVDQIRYHLKDTLSNLGIKNSEFNRMAEQYWKTAFFSDEYVRHDVTVLGAPAYVKRLHELGALVVYLTGRDRPRMEEGTLEALRLNGFPVDDAILIMKPTKEEDDLAFKKKAFDTIAGLGNVVAAFENEPRNANALKETFQDATVVFLDIQHSGSGPLLEGIPSIKNFLRDPRKKRYPKDP